MGALIVPAFGHGEKNKAGFYEGKVLQGGLRNLAQARQTKTLPWQQVAAGAAILTFTLPRSLSQHLYINPWGVGEMDSRLGKTFANGDLTR